MSSVEPLKRARIVALAFAWAFGIIGGSVGLNGLIKANDDKRRLRHAAPPGVHVHIDVTNLFHPGVLATAVSTLLAVVANLLFMMTAYRWIDRLVGHAGPVPLATRTLRLQAGFLAFWSLFLLGCQITFTVVFATKTSDFGASINGVPLPLAVVEATAAANHVTPIYHKIGYLRLQAVLIWFTWLFTTIAAVVIFEASRRRDASSAYPSDIAAPVDDRRESTLSEKDSIKKEVTEEV
ncbi:hypothetical protein FA95DRAFT_1606059 [Auriscalpium vulgare]|uniref:Uncharacterized protein n=1 Tax=Auriscalpium vulgare TaxID=40419 RepID=A0ACB8RTE3_9AGAM|nr:hypothetical protein FA95DRAFT_1606059 [Auriscalpium vulgare]